MEFIVDATNVMNKRGVVYPVVKASTLGYTFGRKVLRRSDDDYDEDYEDGPFDMCATLYEDCGDWWGHLTKANEYDGGAITRKIEEKASFERYTVLWWFARSKETTYNF